MDSEYVWWVAHTIMPTKETPNMEKFWLSISCARVNWFCFWVNLVCQKRKPMGLIYSKHVSLRICQHALTNSVPTCRGLLQSIDKHFEETLKRAFTNGWAFAPISTNKWKGERIQKQNENTKTVSKPECKRQNEDWQRKKHAKTQLLVFFERHSQEKNSIMMYYSHRDWMSPPRRYLGIAFYLITLNADSKWITSTYLEEALCKVVTLDDDGPDATECEWQSGGLHFSHHEIPKYRW